MSMTKGGWLCGLLVASALFGACGDRAVPAAEFGRERFSDPKVSTSLFNAFSCSTCHVVDPSAPLVVPERFDSGYNLAGVATRGGWWGNGSASLLDAVNVCVTQFMSGRALAATDEVARQLDAYLESTSPAASVPDSAATMPAPFTVVRTIPTLLELPGNAARGAEVYRKSCARCHGEAHSGKGQLTPLAVAIPDSTQMQFGTETRAVVIEKIRHGRFFNIGGVMPLYSLEAMSDQSVVDVLAHLGL